MNKTAPHKHAEVIKAWADGRAIQFKSKDAGTSWLTYIGELTHAVPAFNSNALIWRIKPLTQTVEVPAFPTPLREAPLNNTPVFYPTLSYIGIYNSNPYYPEVGWMVSLLENKMLHLSREAAEAHYHAIIALNKQA